MVIVRASVRDGDELDDPAARSRLPPGSQFVLREEDAQGSATLAV
jgi:hypothetical protein